MINLNLHEIAKTIYNDSCLTFGEKILLKSILCTLKKPWVTKHILYHAILSLSGEYFTLNMHFDSTAFLFGGRQLYSYV